MALLVRQHGAISLHPKSIILAVALIFLLGTLLIVYWKPRAGDSIAPGVPNSRKTDAENVKALVANTDIKTDDARQVAETETKEGELPSDKKRSKRLPDAIVVGAGKCGTDALITYLNTSDSFIINTIYNRDLKELNYFNNNYDKGTSWYIENMPPARSDQVIVEKCAPYFWNPVVPERVFQTKPGVKLIFVLCDPVKRLVSLYSHINSYKLSDGSDPLPPFSDIIHMKDGSIHENVHPRPSQPFLESGKYSDFIARWMRYFPASQMVFISGEDLIADPLSQVTKVTEFLGKPDSVTEHNVYYNKERGYYCFRSHDGSNWCMDKSSKGRKHPELDAEVLTALQNHFKPYNDKLEDLVGVKFGWPKYFGKKA